MLKKFKILLGNEIDPAFSKRAEFIFEEIEKERPKKVLDIGCGRGFYVNALASCEFIKEIIGIDKNERYLEVARKNKIDKRVKIMKGSVYAIPFKDNFFDLVICSEVLEHLKNESMALNEIKRVMKRNGELIITVPSIDFPFFWDPVNWVLMKFFNVHVNKDIWWLAGIWADHERLYPFPEIKKKIGESKLSIIKSEKAVNFCWPFSHFLLYGIGKNIIDRCGISTFSRFDFRKNNLKFFLSRLVSFPTKITFGEACVNILLAVKKKAD